MPEPFSPLTERIANPQVECRITATTPATHAIIRANLHRSAVYGGRIAGVGPRYCPSIEDKIVRFAARERHNIFLEPEGLDDDTVYPNGISTSLPEEVQRALLATIPGPGTRADDAAGLCGRIRLRRPARAGSVAGGAAAAGAVPGRADQRHHRIRGSGGAGAAWPGINAARQAGGMRPVALDRSEAYIGVLVDDLTTQGVSEPYRMFTSRAEFRLTLRADNADLRLTGKGMAWGCVGPERAAAFADTSAAAVTAALERARGSRAAIPRDLARHGIAVRADGRWRSVFELLGHPECRVLRRWRPRSPGCATLPPACSNQLRTEVRYDGYLPRQQADIRAFQREEARRARGTSRSARSADCLRSCRAKLTRLRPASLGAASRIQGMTPAALAAIAAHVRKRRGRYRFRTSVRRFTWNIVRGRTMFHVKRWQHWRRFAALLLRWNRTVNLDCTAATSRCFGSAISPICSRLPH